MSTNASRDAASNPIAEIAERFGFMIVDGALATELERLGCDLDDALWSARILAESPQTIRDVHRAYFEAGADCAITASYQATREGFMRAGIEADTADALMQRSVTLAKAARDAFWHEQGDAAARPYPLVAASVGPYGAFLADGSEYRGYADPTIDRAFLANFHRPRLETLLAAEPDLLAVETLPSLEEALAVADLLEVLDARAWITFSARDDQHISDGTPIADCARALADRPQVVAMGINCTALCHITPLIAAIRAETTLPVVVYPNSGEHYDPVSKRWFAADVSTDGADAFREAVPRDLADGLARWLEAGASAMGGCCRTGPDDIRALAARRRTALQAPRAE